jgi:hypothetical protein
MARIYVTGLGNPQFSYCESSTLALTDPQSALTVNSVSYTFTRTGMTDSKGIYISDNGLNVLSIEHSRKARNRTVVRLDRTATVDDPFTTGSSFNSSFSVYTVFDWKNPDFEAADLDYAAQLLEAFMVSGTPDNRLRILKGEI